MKNVEKKIGSAIGLQLKLENGKHKLLPSKFVVLTEWAGGKENQRVQQTWAQITL